MSAIHTCGCLLLWISSAAAQQKTPDVMVTCFNSDFCVLPCTFQPGGNETVEWFRQDALLYSFDRNSSRESFMPAQLAERAFVSPQQISNGNATLILRRSVLKDRGTYRCHVQTSAGRHRAKVILKVEAPIRGLFVEHSRLSGYEEVKCSVPDVFPAPRVTWATEPPTFEALRPITRMHAKDSSLYLVESRVRKLAGHPDLIYICKMTSPYGASSWTASLREREIKGSEGRDLTIRCLAPTYLNNPSLYWTFSRGDNSTLILSYNSRSERPSSLASWDNHLELDIYKAKFGDGSLRLMDPKHLEHSGTYTCEFSEARNKHIERSQVTIYGSQGQQRLSEEPSHWWILGVVAAVVVLVLTGLVAFLKLRDDEKNLISKYTSVRQGKDKKQREDPEEVTELNRVKDRESALQ